MNPQGKKVFRCKLCRAGGHPVKQYEVDGGNSHFRRHIWLDHRVNVLTATEEALEKHTAVISEVQEEELWNDKVRATLKNTILLIASGIKLIQLQALLLN